MSEIQENLILRLLSGTSLAQHRSEFAEVPLVHADVIVRADEQIEFVLFPLTGVISILAITEDGGTVETSVIGKEGVLGSSASLGIYKSYSEAVVQIKGRALRIPVQRFFELCETDPTIRLKLGRFDLALLTQVQQSVACQTLHAAEARAARWMLQCRDLMENDEIQLTQEFLGQMLGVQRSTVNLIERSFQQAGLIEKGRGRLRITDIDGLRECSCECYARIKSRQDELLNGHS